MNRALLLAAGCLAVACQPVPAPASPPAAPLAPAAAAPPGSAAAPSPAAPALPAAWPWPAAPYTLLFEAGRVFSYRVESSSSHYDPDDPKADKNGSVTTRATTMIRCVVENVRRFPRAFEADLTCTPSESFVQGMDATPDGTYLATEAGIWKTSGFGDDPDKLDPKEMLLAAEPVEVDDETPGPAPGQDPEFGEAHQVTRGADGAWCANRSSWGGDEAWNGVCFSPNEGLVAGEAGWAGGSSHEASFILVK